MLVDGSATITIRYLYITNNGESVTRIRTGKQASTNKRGIVQVTAEGTMYTSASKLSHLNGGKWSVNGEVNTIRETVGVRGSFTPISSV
jgi:hypothetical protein